MLGSKWKQQETRGLLVCVRDRGFLWADVLSVMPKRQSCEQPLKCQIVSDYSVTVCGRILKTSLQQKSFGFLQFLQFPFLKRSQLLKKLSHIQCFLRPHGLQPARPICPWDFPGKNTGVGCHFLLQGIFLTKRLNPCLLHCRPILYCWATREAYTVPYWLIWWETEGNKVSVSQSLWSWWGLS